jgi:hypothetical protein
MVGSRKGQRWETTIGYGGGGHGEAGGGVDAVTSHLLINDLDDVIRTSRLTRRLMTLITSSWSLTFDSSDVTNAINCRSHRWKVIPPSGLPLLISVTKCNSTVNRGFATRRCGLPLYILFCHWNVSPRVILLRNEKHGNMLVFRRFGVGGGRAGGDNLNIKAVGLIKETVGTWRRMKWGVIGSVT